MRLFFDRAAAPMLDNLVGVIFQQGADFVMRLGTDHVRINRHTDSSVSGRTV